MKVAILATTALTLGGCLESSGQQVPLYSGENGGPAITSAGDGPSNPIDYHQVNSSSITWYETDGTGNCSYDASVKNVNVAAVSNFDYDGSFACGAFIRVYGPDGSVTARVTDRCPHCQPGEVALSVSAFKAVGDVADGSINGTWQFTQGEVSGPMRYRLKKGSNNYWSALQVMNHRHAIARLELLRGDGTWVTLERQTYNYFVYDRDWGNSPRDLRITDVFGQSVIDEAVILKVGLDVPGSSQLPQLNGGGAVVNPFPGLFPSEVDDIDEPGDNETSDGEVPIGPSEEPVEGAVGAEPVGATGTDEPMEGEAQVTPGLNLRIEQETAWATGYCSDVFIENVSEVPIEWQVVIPIEHALHYVWSADYTLDIDNEVLTLFGHPWNAVLEPGDEIDFGFCTEDNP